MIFQKKLDPYLSNLLFRAEKRFGKNRNYFIEAKFWDDGDFEIKLCSTWGLVRHEFTYRKSLDNYFYKPVEIGSHNLGGIIE